MRYIKRILQTGLRMEGLDAKENAPVLCFGLFLAAVAVALRFFFWWYTGRVWEDALITVLHSENFARGLGLTHYRVGQPPLHGFTSPLSVLVPLIGDLFRVGFGLRLIKIVSAFAGGLTVLYGMAIAIHPKVKLPAPLAVMAMGYLACEHHQILYGMAGMETQLVVLVLLMTLYYAIALRPVALGISLGLCMLARPDFAFVTIIVGLYILVVKPAQFFKVAGVALAVYLPWVAFTTLYYGSPIPNTIVAKGLGYRLWTRAPDLTWADVWDNVVRRVTGSYLFQTIFQPLGPSFAGQGTHFRPVIHDRGMICNAMAIMAVVGALAALRRRQWALLPAICFVAVYTVYYVFFVANVFGWYVVPFVAATLFLSARGLQAAFGWIKPKGLQTAALSVIAALYLASITAILPKTFATDKQIQEVVENPVRKQAGLYLNRVMGKNETIGCECLGYIAYYSRGTVYDWPGLASRRVVEYSKTHPGKRTMIDMLDHLRPDYLVLRHRSYANYKKRGVGWLDTDYRIVASFEVDYDKGRNIFLIDKNLDLYFFVLKKIAKKVGCNLSHRLEARVREAAVR